MNCKWCYTCITMVTVLPWSSACILRRPVTWRGYFPGQYLNIVGARTEFLLWSDIHPGDFCSTAIFWLSYQKAYVQNLCNMCFSVTWIHLIQKWKSRYSCHSAGHDDAWWVEWIVLPPFILNHKIIRSVQLASRSGRCTPGGKIPATLWIRRWVDISAELLVDTMEKR